MKNNLHPILVNAIQSICDYSTAVESLQNPMTALENYDDIDDVISALVDDFESELRSALEGSALDNLLQAYQDATYEAEDGDDYYTYSEYRNIERERDSLQRKLDSVSTKVDQAKDELNDAQDELLGLDEIDELELDLDDEINEEDL